MYRYISKIFIVIALFLISTAGIAEGIEVRLGNGIEARGSIGKLTMFTVLDDGDDYNGRMGFIYKVKEGPNWSIGIGGGIASADERFSATVAAPGEFEGYRAVESTEHFPFLQIEAARGSFFIEVFYGDTDFTAYRGRVIDPGNPGRPPVTEVRIDQQSGPGTGVFIGFRIAIDAVSF